MRSNKRSGVFDLYGVYVAKILDGFVGIEAAKEFDWIDNDLDNMPKSDVYTFSTPERNVIKEEYVRLVFELINTGFVNDLKRATKDGGTLTDAKDKMTVNVRGQNRCVAR